MVTEYTEKGQLPVLPVTAESDGLKVYSSENGQTLSDLLNNFLHPLISGEDFHKSKRYLALHVYLKPSLQVSTLLEKFRTKILNNYGVAVTIGFGPRFLHSTGQLHKGDEGMGLFIQLLADMPEDCPIPDNPKDQASSISFGVLKLSQSLGDRQALIDAGRKVMTIDLGSDIEKGIEKLIGAVE